MTERIAGTFPVERLVPIDGFPMKVGATPLPGVLIVDEDQRFAHSFQDALSAAGVVSVVASTAAKARALMSSSHTVFLAFVDLHIPTAGGFELMRVLHGIDPTLSVILISERASLAAAVGATRRGAEDFIVKPFDISAVAAKVGYFKALLQRQTHTENGRVRTVPAHTLENIICRSQEMRKILDVAKKIAQMPDSALLVGERGVGKEVLARAIHAASPRGQGPFFQIDCPFFAHDLPRRAPFIPDMPASPVSVAALERIFKATVGGTLYLSEVGELPQDIQEKLVNILGATRSPNAESSASVRPSPRVLASTSRSLEELRDKCLRKDLYQYIADVVIEVPPLRDRPEDIPPLVRYFSDRLGERYRHQFVLSWSGIDLLFR